MAAARPSALFLSATPPCELETGPVRRLAKLAETVAEHCAVTLAAPPGTAFPEGPFATVEAGWGAPLRRALQTHDVVVTQTLPSPRRLAWVRRHARRLVVDVIAPIAFEVGEAGTASGARDALARWRVRELIAHIAAADLVLCTNERQADLFAGVELAAGSRGAVPAPLTRNRIAIVPHGLDEDLPRAGGSPLRASGAVGDADRIALWAGGMWDWLDPLTAVRALERLRPRRPDLRLALVGCEHPDPAVQSGHGAVMGEVTRYVRDRRLEPAVVLRERWLPRPQYVDHLLEADVGLSLHRPTRESRFASRTRVLDYLHAGLPTVCSAGDTMAELVRVHGLGAVIAPLDVDACAAALDDLTGPGRHRIEDRSVLDRFRWRTVARPLVEFCLEPCGERPEPARWAALGALRDYPAFIGTLLRSDARALPRELSRRARPRP